MPKIELPPTKSSLRKLKENLAFAYEGYDLLNQKRGWIYYRKKKPSSSALSNACLEVQQLLEPSKKYVVEVKKDEKKQQAEAGDLPPHPDPTVATQKLLGVPMEYAQPKEGAVVLNVAECVIARNDQPELAQKLAAFLLTAEAQAPALEEGDQIPSNPTTPTSDKTRARVEAMQGYLQTAISIDWDQVNQARPEWNARWSRSIER